MCRLLRRRKIFKVLHSYFIPYIYGYFFVFLVSFRVEIDYLVHPRASPTSRLYVCCFSFYSAPMHTHTITVCASQKRISNQANTFRIETCGKHVTDRNVFTMYFFFVKCPTVCVCYRVLLRNGQYK